MKQKQLSFLSERNGEARRGRIEGRRVITTQEER